MELLPIIKLSRKCGCTQTLHPLRTVCRAFIVGMLEGENAPRAVGAGLFCILLLLYSLLSGPTYDDKGKAVGGDFGVRGRVDPSSLSLWSWGKVDQLVAENHKLLVISGDVLNVTDFISLHPGGPYVIEQRIGADATQDFAGGVHLHSPEARKMLADYKIVRPIPTLFLPIVLLAFFVSVFPHRSFFSALTRPLSLLLLRLVFDLKMRKGAKGADLLFGSVLKKERARCGLLYYVQMSYVCGECFPRALSRWVKQSIKESIRTS
jgi:Cytochrome b5-like Heme/Steroid binding domain